MNIIPYVFVLTTSIVSFIFFIFLVITYNRKNTKNSIKNQNYKRMLWCTGAVFLLEFLYLFMIKYSSISKLAGFTWKLILIFFLAFIILWIYYVFTIIFENRQDSSNIILQNHNSIDLYLILGICTISIIDYFLPVSYAYGQNALIQSVGGAGCIFLYILIVIVQLSVIPAIIINRDTINHKRLIPYYIIMCFTFIFLIILHFIPYLCIMDFILTLSLYIIYSKLENPDIISVQKYKRSRDQLKYIREKYGFLFNMSPELRDLLNEVTFMKDNYLMDKKKGVSKKKLETLINDFIRSGEEGVTTKTNIDDDGIEILELEDEVPEEMLITKEIYSLQELKEVLKEDNLPKW